MRQLLGLFAFATLSGCLSQDGLSDNRGDKHTLTLNWRLKQPGGADAQCPPGFANLLLSSTTVEATGQVQTLVPCQTSGTQTIELYTSGERQYKMDNDPSVYTESFTPNYAEIVYITDPTGAVVRAQSLATRVTLDSDKTVNVDVYPDAGFVLFSWDLWSGITTSRVYSCPAVAVDEMELSYRMFTYAGDPPAPSTSVKWPCMERHADYYISSEATGQGFAPALAPNDYLASLIAYRNGVEVARNDSIAFNIKTGGLLTETQDSVTVADR